MAESEKPRRRPVINLDANLFNADWTKQTWDLPPYKSEEFMAYLQATGSTLERFRQLPVYQFAVEQGLIVDDEWQGDSGGR